jgi:hypothetical protein
VAAPADAANRVGVATVAVAADAAWADGASMTTVGANTDA